MLKKLAEIGKHVDLYSKFIVMTSLDMGEILLDSKYFLKSECRNAIRPAYFKNISNKFHFLKLRWFEIQSKFLKKWFKSQFRILIVEIIGNCQMESYHTLQKLKPNSKFSAQWPIFRQKCTMYLPKKLKSLFMDTFF